MLTRVEPLDRAIANVWGSYGRHRFSCYRQGPPGRGSLQEDWVGVCGPLPKTFTLLMTKICDFPYPIYDLALRPLGAGVLLALSSLLNGVGEGKARMGEGRRDEEVASFKKE